MWRRAATSGRPGPAVPLRNEDQALGVDQTVHRDRADLAGRQVDRAQGVDRVAGGRQVDGALLALHGVTAVYTVPGVNVPVMASTTLDVESVVYTPGGRGRQGA